jgi:hypothetical protein
MSDDTNKTLDFNYVKSNTFREVACDGIVGGATPQNKIWLSFYTERFPIPRIVRHKIVETNIPNEFALDPNVEPQSIDARSGIVRTVEFGVFLSVETALQLREWLDGQIKSAKGIK